MFKVKMNVRNVINADDERLEKPELEISGFHVYREKTSSSEKTVIIRVYESDEPNENYVAITMSPKQASDLAFALRKGIDEATYVDRKPNIK